MEISRATLTDEWDGIDPKIERVVLALNAHGFRTTGSCEGHLTKGSPVPWVAMNLVEEEGGRKMKEAETRKLRGKMQALLAKFYSNRVVADNVRLVTRQSNSGFWLHNGGLVYGKWRLYVEKTVTKIARGEKIKPLAFTKEEKLMNATNLPLYQNEMEEFAKFLEKEKL